MFHFCPLVIGRLQLPMIVFLEAKQAERLDIEEKYNSLQEEAAGKTKKLKKVWTMYNAAKSELEDVRQVIKLTCLLTIRSNTGPAKLTGSVMIYFCCG